MDLSEVVVALRQTGVEFEDIEVKRAEGGLPQSLPSTLSAFANTRGGLIILGLDEMSGFGTTGVKDPRALRDELTTMARNKLTPPLSPSIEVIPFEGKALLVAEIEALPPAQRPCFVTTRGLYNGAFIRVGDADQRLTPYEIDRMRENAGQPRWDEEPVSQASAADLDPEALSRLIATATRNSPRSLGGLLREEALARLGVLVPHDGRMVPSLGGLLSVGRYPQQFFPQLMVTVAVYPHSDPQRPGPGGVRFLDTATVGGPVPTMVTDTIQAVRRNLRVSSRIVGAGREERWEIEPEVIREAVVNALMHRDYSPQARGTQVQVDLFPDRLTVSSPGGLFGNVRLETLGQAHTSSSRNARLAALLQEAGDPVTGRPVAENRGSGISMMISSVYRDTGLVPLFASTLDDFRVTIPRTSPVTAGLSAWIGRVAKGADLTQAQISALGLAHAGHDIDAAVLRRLGAPVEEAQHQLTELRNLGFLSSRRARDDGPYRLTPGLPVFTAENEAARRPGNGLAAQILEVLSRSDSVSREELQEQTGGSRAGVIKALDALLTSGEIEATAPARSPNRRYRLASGDH
jgi:ATP-dependent DNA helicase RecG